MRYAMRRITYLVLLVILLAINIALALGYVP